MQLVQGLGKPKVLVMGDFILDRYLWGSVDRISPEAPIPVLRVDRRDLRPGGAGSVAADLRALGARVAVAGIVGKDPEAKLLRGLLKELGATTTGLIADPSRPTTVKTRMIARSQQMLRVDEESNAEIGATIAKRLAAACAKVNPGCDAVVIQDHGKGAVTRSLVAEVVRACRGRSIPLVVDPAPNGDYAKYRGATLLTPNRAETRQATGVRITDERSAGRAARKLIADLKLKAAVITLDREGMAVAEKGRKTVVVPAHALEVYDVTGAGDVVAATIALCLANGQELLDAAHLANIAAGIEVGKVGVGTVSPREILERLQGGAESKIKSRSDLATICSDLHSRGRTIVFTNGCFDLLHIGHIRLLTEAKKFGDMLVVAINSDASTRRVKGPDRPIIPEDARAGMLAATECVDYVNIYDDDTPIPLLKLLRPDVIVKGAEYGKEGVVGGKLVESWGGRIELAHMMAGFSTTRVAEKAGKSKRKKQGSRGYVRKN
jgi:D-beta-D-heptose 7-phosphate kinase/D-beta-D-heptose 1-phosphate adenosyltransferase